MKLDRKTVSLVALVIAVTVVVSMWDSMYVAAERYLGAISTFLGLE